MERVIIHEGWDGDTTESFTVIINRDSSRTFVQDTIDYLETILHVVMEYRLNDNNIEELDESTKQLITSIVSKPFPIVEGISEDCPVCLEPTTTLQVLSCNHKFCTQCLSKWLVRHKNCPICRCIVDIHFHDPTNDEGVPDFWFILIRDVINALREANDDHH